MAVAATGVAFGAFRAIFALKECPQDRIANADQLRLVGGDDGLKLWEDGPGGAAGPSEPPPLLREADAARRELWVVRSADVAYSPERSEFASRLESGVLKHSNLTGGAPAHCGGELVFVSEDTVVVSGVSGRYGPRSAEEMKAVAMAFRQSGFNIWSMGYDAEADRPFPLVGKAPEWVQP